MSFFLCVYSRAFLSVFAFFIELEKVCKRPNQDISTFFSLLSSLVDRKIVNLISFDVFVTSLRLSCHWTSSLNLNVFEFDSCFLFVFENLCTRNLSSSVTRVMFQQNFITLFAAFESFALPERALHQSPCPSSINYWRPVCMFHDDISDIDGSDG